MIRILVCPRCQKRLRLDDSRGLKAGMCPGCGQKFRVPRPKGTADPAGATPRPAPPPAPAPAVPPPRESPPPVRAQHIQPTVNYPAPSPPLAAFKPPAAPAAPAPPQVAIPEADILEVDDVAIATPVGGHDPSGYQLAGVAPASPAA